MDDVGAGSSATLAPVPEGAVVSPASPTTEVESGRPPRRWGTPAVLGLSFAGYLALSVLVWWGVWSTHPTTVTTCGCGDTSLFLWFLEWPAYALAHGHNPFYSTALFHPAGIDLLSNTSVLAVGIPLAPITWLFGPVATLNVASTLAPALSALAMCWLLRRWVTWAPAAFIGGLVYGFSPFAFVNLAGAHLMAAVLVLPPLMVACLDDLLIRRRHRPVVTGAVLGVLVTIQFFVGTEVLAMVVVMMVVGVLFVVAYGALVEREEFVARAPQALAGLATAVGVAAMLLAYPAWVALAGPAHLGGLVWPTIKPGRVGISVSDLWQRAPMTTLKHEMSVVGGYQGPALPQPAYLGAGTLLVCGLGTLIWRRDRRLWFFGALGVVGVVLSLGVKSFWTPWRVLVHVPLVRNVVADRFAAVTLLCVAVILAVVVDRTRTSVADALQESRPADLGGEQHPDRRTLARTVGALAALAVAAVAVVPVVGDEAGNVPLTTTTVSLPTWFAKVGPHLPPGQVVLTYPAPFTLEQSAEGWQALDGLEFSLVGGSGPEGLFSRAGPERAGQEVVSAASFSLTGPPAASTANVEAVRHALQGWGVTTIVMPDPRTLPRYEQGTNPASALGLFTLAVGRAPVYVDRAWVWTGVRSPAMRRSVVAAAFDRCTSTVRGFGPSPQTVPDCVLSVSQPVG